MVKKVLVSSIVSLSLLAGALAVLAETTTTESNPAKTVNIACVQTAVGVSETAIQVAFSKFSTAISSALQTRASALSAAWTMTDKKQRNAAIKTAWANFKTAKKDTTKTFRTEQSVAWKQFAKNRKACKAEPTNESQGDDISL